MQPRNVLWTILLVGWAGQVRAGASVNGVDLGLFTSSLRKMYDGVKDRWDRRHVTRDPEFKNHTVVLKELDHAQKDPSLVGSRLVPALTFYLQTEFVEEFPPRIQRAHELPVGARVAILSQVGRYLIAGSEGYKARSFFESILLIQPGNYNAVIGMVESMTRPPPAGFGVAQLGNLLPPEPSRVLAGILLKERRPRWAALYLEDVLARSPGDPSTWNLLGDAHRQGGDLERAQAAYARALKLLEASLR